ncbi:hypothetical protein VT98_12372 [Candidatus Electrothrix communis]|uniref:Uncharacterized protein n=1 Tax=Candidatus Electrothrix communis TaxID=1859133 RepID=A0A444J1P5_9BACT|nr:hypothetical protein [Desulfobulbus sp. US4]MCW5204591.1 hypothetical protein [Desulfobulbus sp. N2]MCW5214362.1 hypothetical protein [Desulfobulbus sp. US5]RWX47074.1 hypothetical protein VT98_12372 [Candidatus Electrothrix communis]WLE99226.1 MAG: hypothetical protein QTN59_10385 [Candidatus Electrothrix communis]
MPSGNRAAVFYCSFYGNSTKNLPIEALELYRTALRLDENNTDRKALAGARRAAQKKYNKAAPLPQRSIDALGDFFPNRHPEDNDQKKEQGNTERHRELLESYESKKGAHREKR